MHGRALGHIILGCCLPQLYYCTLFSEQSKAQHQDKETQADFCRGFFHRAARTSVTLSPFGHSINSKACALCHDAKLRAIFRAEQSNALQQDKETQAGFCRGIVHRAGRGSETHSLFGCSTGAEATRCRRRQALHTAAGKRVLHNSCSVLKYELGKETKRYGSGLKGTHLFSRSIYLFIN